MSDNKFVIENKTLVSYSGADEYVEIPAEVEKIGEGVFKNNGCLKRVKFNCANLKAVEDEAFYGCDSLVGIKLPDGTIHIGDRAFKGCSKMDWIYIPDSVMSIGKEILDFSTSVLGKNGSAAEKYAKDNNLNFKTDNPDAIIRSIERRTKEAETVETKTFDIFGEKIVASKTLIRYHETLQYYTSRYGEFFDEMVKGIPTSVTNSGKIKNPAATIDVEQNLTKKRLEKSGIFVSDTILLGYTNEGIQAILKCYQVIVDSFSKLVNSAVSDRERMINYIYDQAESQVTGLSYGYIGDGLGMIGYAFDDYFEKKKQRKRAYAIAEQQKATYVNQQNASINGMYAQLYDKFLPIYNKATDSYISGLLKCEMIYISKHGLIESDLKDRYDITKSVEIINGLNAKKSSNADYAIALALKMYPMNISAHIYAIENDITCDGLEELREFLGLHTALQPHRDRVRANKVSEISEKVLRCFTVRKSISTIKEHTDFLNSFEIKGILKKVSEKIAPSVEAIADMNPGSVAPRTFCAEKLRLIIDDDSWGFFNEYSVEPVSSSSIPAGTAKSKEKMITHLEEKLLIAQGDKEKILEESRSNLLKDNTLAGYSELMKTLDSLGNYKDASELHRKAMKKRDSLGKEKVSRIIEEIGRLKTSGEFYAIETKINEYGKYIDVSGAREKFYATKNRIIANEQQKKKNMVIAGIAGVILFILIIAVLAATAPKRAFNKMIKNSSFDFSVENIADKIEYDYSFKAWAKKKIGKKLEKYQKNDDFESVLRLVFNSSTEGDDEFASEYKNHLELRAEDDFMDWLILRSLEKGVKDKDNDCYDIICKENGSNVKYSVVWEDDYEGNRIFRIYRENSNIDVEITDDDGGFYEIDAHGSYDKELKLKKEEVSKAEYEAEQAAIKAEKEAILAEKKSNYEKGVKLFAEGKKAEAAIAFGKAQDYSDAKTKSAMLWNEIAVRRNIVAAGSNFTVAVKNNGTVAAVGSNAKKQCDVSTWNDIVSVAAGDNFTVGLKADGTVVAVGYNYNSQCNVTDWKDIVSVAAGDNFTVGLKADGTVVAIGYNNNLQCNVRDWTDIVSIAAGDNFTVGLKTDGTVVMTGSFSYRSEIEKWDNIVAVAAGTGHIVGLKADGTVVAAGSNRYNQCEVEGWSGIKSISAGDYFTLGVKADGTVVAVGDNDDDQTDTALWTDIVAVAGGYDHAVGIKSNGTAVGTGDNRNNEIDVASWRGIKTPEVIPQETPTITEPATEIVTEYATEAVTQEDEYVTGEITW